MKTNKILVTLKTPVLYTMLTMLMAACSTKDNGDIDAQLANINNRLSVVDAKRDSILVNTDQALADSIKRDGPTMEIAKNIEKYKKPMAKLTAPKDSTMRKRYNRKIESLRVDSIMRTAKLKDAILQMYRDELNAISQEQTALAAKRDSLMKIKSR